MVALNGFHPVDVFEITDDVANYFEHRGAAVTKLPSWNGKSRCNVQFPNCKRTTGMSGSNTIRIFFPNEEEIMLFSMVFGHLIQNTRVKALHEMILEQRFGIQDS